MSEGLEGSVLEGAKGSGDTSGGGTGAGAEATEGMRGAPSRRGESSRSEPQHVSGYGGAGGTPKTSSDQREPSRPREQPLGGSRKRGSRAQGGLGDEE